MQPQDIFNRIMQTAELEIVSHRHFAGRHFLHKDHSHSDAFQVGYMLKGRCRLVLDGRTVSMRSGDAIVFTPGQMHGPAPQPRPARTELLQLKFSVRGRNLWPHGGVINVDSRLEFESVFRDMMAEFHMRRFLREKLLRAHLLHLMLILRRSARPARAGRRLRDRDDLPARDERKVRQAMDWMTRHCHADLSLPQVAAFTGMSVSALSRAFKMVTGVPPMRYLADYRLAQAVALMRHTDDKLDAIAAAVGFSSSNYLSRVFQKRFQQTPRAYAARREFAR